MGPRGPTAKNREPRARSIPPGRINPAALALILLGAAGMAGVVLLIGMLHREWVVATLPEGWQIIRPPHEVCTLALDGEVVWAGGRDGLFRFDRERAEGLALPEGAPRMSYVASLLRDGQGRLWIAHLEGLTCLKGSPTTSTAEQWLTWPVGADGPRARPLALQEDTDGTLWVGTENGLQQLREGHWRTVEIPKDLGLTAVDVLYRDRSNIWWLGCASPTRGGLFSYDGRRWRAYGHADGLCHLSVNAVTQRRDGTLWVATGFANQGGASRWTGERFETWTTKDGLAGEKVRSIFEDRAGRLWFGSEYDGVTVLDGGHWRILRPQMGLAGREAKAIVEDPDGVYWIGTDQGLSRIASWPPTESTEGAP